MTKKTSTTDRSRPASLVIRVTVLVGLATTLSAFALGLFVQQSIKLHFIDQEAEELRVMADSIEDTLARAAPLYEGAALTRELAGAVAGHHDVYYLISDKLTNPIYQSPGPDLIPIATTIAKVNTITAENLHEWEDSETIYSGAVLSLTVDNSLTGTPPEYILVVAADMNDHFEYLARFNRTLWSIICTISLFAVLAAWVAARQAHTPLHELSEKISNISSDKLDERLDESKVPAELVELVRSFNAMIVRIEEVFEKLSNFSADLAHEFRTPISNSITQTQVALAKARSADEYKEILYSNLEEYERMSKMVGNMLFLAQTDNGLIVPTFERLRLSEEITTVFEYFEAWAEENNVELILSGDCPDIVGDKSMLRRALSNLVSNAIRHSASNHSVSLNIQHEDGFVLIDIQNSGKEIPAIQLSKIFDRFYQADDSRQSEGAGLGLAIVKSIVELHKGKVFAFSDDGVTRFTIKFPLSINQSAS